jgi:hypothetical protein
MLSPQLHALIEAVRSVDIEIVSRDGQEMVRIPGGAKHLPDRLIALQRALENYDNAEASGEADSYSFLLVATKALAAEVKRKGDRRNTYNIVNDAISKYGDQAWAGRSSRDLSNYLEGRDPQSEKIDSALASSEEFRRKSLEKAKADMQERADQGPDDEDVPAEPSGPKSP